jgi:hypothetical protein
MMKSLDLTRSRFRKLQPMYFYVFTLGSRYLFYYVEVMKAQYYIANICLNSDKHNDLYLEFTSEVVYKTIRAQ